MFSDCCSAEDLRREAVRQRGLAGFLKDSVVAASLRAAADELEHQAQLIESKGPTGPQHSAA